MKNLFNNKLQQQLNSARSRRVAKPMGRAACLEGGKIDTLPTNGQLIIYLICLRSI